MEHKMLSLGLMSSRLDYIRLNTSDWDIRIGEGRHLLIQPNFIGSLLPTVRDSLKLSSHHVAGLLIYLITLAPLLPNPKALSSMLF